jgi:RND family efflux transporter MFP subunit
MMAVWKQIGLSLFILAVAFVVWARFVPGASNVLASWGIDWAQAAVPAKGDGAQQERSAQGRRNAGAQGSVVAGPVTPATINDRLAAIGTGRANASVVVKPYSSGRLMEILVMAGSSVKAGDVLARMESDAEQIALDRAKIALRDAISRADRVKALRSSNTATAVQQSDADLAVENARLEVSTAQLEFDRRTIVAPISGVVGILPVEAGNFVTAETALATIDDRSSIIVDFWAPERYADAIAVGQEIEASPIAQPSLSLKGQVSAVDNRLDEASRTMLVRARLANADDALRAGMSFQVMIRFPGNTYPSVNPLAIQWGTDGAYVWALRDGKAKRTPVKVVQRNTDSVLVEAALTPEDQVVTEGVHLVREGATVSIAGEPARNAPAPAPASVSSGAAPVAGGG